MKIHFREIEGKQAVYAEIDGLFYKRKSRTFFPSLPGSSLPWKKLDTYNKNRLFIYSSLKVEADNNKVNGEAYFPIPSLSDLWKSYDKDLWDETYNKVEETAWSQEEFITLARWWEYLRRSEVFKEECQVLRGSLVKDNWLAWVAFAGLAQRAFHLGTCYVFKELGCLEHSLSPDAPHAAKYHDLSCYKQMRLFCFKWDLPLLESLLFLNPEETTAQDLATSWLCINNFVNNDPISEFCKEEGWDTVF